jgi:transposase-like protein
VDESFGLLALYMFGMSMNSIAKLLKVSAPCVLFWVRDFAKEIIQSQNREKLQ